MNDIWTIHASRQSDLQERVAKLNRKAEKLGLAPIEIHVVRTFEKKDDTTNRYEPYVDVYFHGVAPVINGHMFLARITHTEAGNIIGVVPSQTDHGLDLTRYRDCGADCDHCGFIRNRKDTFLIRDDQGGILQVGRTCLKDYTRSEDAGVAVKAFALFTEAEEIFREYTGCGGNMGFYALRPFLALVHAVIRTEGWVSGKKSYETGMQSTASQAEYYYNSPDCGPDVTDEDMEAAENAVEWGLALGDREEPLNDYQHNLFVAIALGYVNFRSAGLAASVFAAMQFERDRENKLARTVNEHIGKIKERLTLNNVTFQSVHWLNNEWGTGVYRFADAAGRVLTWFTSRDFGLAAGERLNLTGTVKAHDEYKGTLQTVLTRCKLEKA